MDLGFDFFMLNKIFSSDMKLLQRWMIVTPDMHRIHHSVLPQETNSNFGFNLPWWDRLLGTYREDPLRNHTIMSLGLEQFRDPRRLTLGGILALPFLGTPGRYPLARRE
jgi:sterol desaturase/sphingolipid hydroxylase (fatty acid hydroxylase superfamily)